MSNIQAVYLIIVDPHPEEDIRAFSVVVLTSEPGSRAHYCSIPKGPSSYLIQTTAKLFVPPLQHGSNFFRSPLFVEVKLTPPLPFCSPPPPLIQLNRLLRLNRLPHITLTEYNPSCSVN